MLGTRGAASRRAGFVSWKYRAGRGSEWCPCGAVGVYAAMASGRARRRRWRAVTGARLAVLRQVDGEQQIARAHSTATACAGTADSASADWTTPLPSSPPRAHGRAGGWIPAHYGGRALGCRCKRVTSGREGCFSTLHAQHAGFIMTPAVLEETSCVSEPRRDETTRPARRR